MTAFVRDETKLLSLVDTPIPPNLRVSIGDISKSADIVRVMVGHDVAINAAGQVTEGSTFTRLVQTVVDSTIASLGEGGRLWLFGGAALQPCRMHSTGCPLGQYRAVAISGSLQTSSPWSVIGPIREVVLSDTLGLLREA